MDELSSRTGDAAGAPRLPSGNRIRPTNPFVEFERCDTECGIPARFEKIARERPDSVALLSRAGTVTYAQLNEKSNRFAHAVLAACGKGPGRVVLLMREPSAAIPAIFGILKAGKAYVPLDPSMPQARIAHVANDAQASLAVADEASIAAVPDNLKTANADDLGAGGSEGNPCIRIERDAAAAIFYTSGSTGHPKGVMETHWNVLHSVMASTNEFHVSSDDRFSLLTPVSFVWSLTFIFVPLLNGAVCVPFDLRSEGAARLADRLQSADITVVGMVPTVFRSMAQHLSAQRFQRLRLVMLGGETVQRSDIELYRRHFPDGCLLAVCYGATETCGGIACLFLSKKITGLDSQTVPVGYPMMDTEVLVIGEDGKESPVGGVGEIVVKSPSLSCGYWGRPDLTKQVFVPDPRGDNSRAYRTGDLGRLSPDGCLTHLGRMDHLVKVRGGSVEAGEVEAALLRVPGVANAAVVPQASRDGAERLVAYVVAGNEAGLTVSRLRASLQDVLPDYMIPSAFVFMSALPQTSTGKVDRQALPRPDGARPLLDVMFVAPRTLMEERLAGMWADLLNVSPVGVKDSFLDLGGDSLMAVQLISRVRDEFGVESALAGFLEAPTVEALALEILAMLLADSGVDAAAGLMPELDDHAGRAGSS